VKPVVTIRVKPFFKLYLAQEPLRHISVDDAFSQFDLKEEPKSTRDIGAILRWVVTNAWEKYEQVELDFESETIASGSIFDELAKLFDEFPKEEVKRRLKFVNIDEWDQNLFLHLAKMRLEDQKKVLQPA